LTRRGDGELACEFDDAGCDRGTAEGAKSNTDINNLANTRT
jgi:hypothetical protein